MQHVFFFDQTRCTECGTCVVACKDWNGVNPGTVKWRRIYDHDKREEGIFPNIRVKPLVYSCNHCEEPACVRACSIGAISKRSEDGIVLVDREKCQNLRVCVSACPFGAVQIAGDEQETAISNWTVSHPAQKCTFCIDRLNDNQKPSCVMACPQRALDAGPADYIFQRHPDAVRATEVDGVPDDIYAGIRTRPNLYIKKS
jgi:anaerobic dimethyl sulfoxide reductase subunit B (iron-sulfur subunit)